MKKAVSALLSITLFLSVFLAACEIKGPASIPEFYLASEISEDVKSEAETVLFSFIQAFEEENAAKALPLFSSGFEFSEAELSAFFKELSKLTNVPFVPYDAYYMNDLQVSDALIKIKKAESDGNYIELTPAARELYCAMYVSEGEKVSYMMTLLLAREGKNFKIAWINPTDFKYEGNNAPAIYEKTKTLSAQKKLIPAYISSCMLSSVLRPGGYFRYEKDVEMEDLCYKLYSEISDEFELPLALEATSDSSLYEIGITKDEQHGVIPLIMFKTSAPISDAERLKTEAERVLAAIEKLSPGLGEIAEYACFEATNDEISGDVSSVKSKRVLLPLK